MFWICLIGLFALITVFLLVACLSDRIVERNGKLSAGLDRLHFAIFLVIFGDSIILVLFLIIWIINKLCA